MSILFTKLLSKFIIVCYIASFWS